MMRLPHCLRTLSLLLLGLAAMPLPAAAAGPSPGASHVAGELLVKYHGDAVSRQPPLVSGAVASPIAHMKGLQRLRLPAGVSVAEALARYRNAPGVLYAEPNFIARKTRVPDDSRYAEQWTLPLLRMPAAWDIATGDGSTIIAILDTGIDYTHPDLAGNMWLNAGEVPDDGLDNDGNGYVDDLYGYSFNSGNDSSDPMDDDTADAHGTHVAGIAAAVGNNNEGISGVTWNARLMAVKALHGPDGEGTSLDIATGIRYAVDNGARVINLSLGFAGYSQTLADAVQYADNHGVLIVSASGNDGLDLSGRDEMPATLRIANNITVAATTRYEELADYSNYGPYNVDLAAPGGDYATADGAIISTVSPITGLGYYAHGAGTSMAAPQVSGLAALVWSVYPTLDHYRVKARILNSVSASSKLAERTITGGRIDGYAGLTRAELPAVFDVTPADLPAGGTVTIRGVNFGNIAGSVSLDDAAMTVTRWDADGRLLEAETPPCGVSGRVRVNGEGSSFPIELQQLPTVTIAPPLAVGDTPYTVRLTAQASDPNGEVVQYAWDTDGSGFGTPQADNSIVVSFAAPGDYTVRVRAIDDCGYAASSMRLVAIRSTTPASGGDDSRCFIATAAWGSSLHPRVQTLRDFRDRFLMDSETGRELVALYYRLSPPLADYIRQRPALRALTATLLRPVVAAAEWSLALSGQPGDDHRPLPAPSATQDFVAGELLMRFRDTVDEGRRQALLAAQHAEVIHRDASGQYYLRLPEGVDTLQAIEWFASQPEVEFAEPNYRARKTTK